VNLIERAKNILITPKTEWEVIAGETTPTGALITGYVLPLAGVSALAGFLGSLLLFTTIGFGMAAIGMSFVGLILRLVLAVVSVFVLGFVIDALAPSFGGQKNMAQATKVAVYSYTSAWVAGIATIVPILGALIALIGALYGLYILYLGLPRLMKNPEDKSIGYTVVVVIVAIVLWAITAAFVAAISATATIGAGMMSGGFGGFGRHAERSAVTFDKDSAMGKLETFGKSMEAAGKKMEAAKASGDPNAQAAAAMEAMGTAFSGGRKVEPLALEEVKAFLPETLGGMPRTSQSAERTGIATLMVSTAKATYGDNSGKQIRMEVTDAGGAGAMMGLATAVGAVGMEREDDNSAERTRKEGNRIVHEKMSKRGGSNEFDLVIADRFIVKAEGSGVDLATLKAAVGTIDLGKLESLKDVGVAKN
jgi:hypothetical protein